MEAKNFEKRGYLNSNFHYFHLKDTKSKSIEYHYHEFHKIVIFLSGNVTYMVEGKAYQLMPWDILLIPSLNIHRPIISPEVPYERIILWVHDSFLQQEMLHSYKLNKCFYSTQEKSSNLLRSNAKNRMNIVSLLTDLENSIQSNEFGAQLYTDTLFLQLLISLNRLILTDNTVDISSSVQSNKHVDLLIAYINQHLGDDLSIETLSKELYLSASHLMHQFKKTTGTSLHAYITRKRLANALRLLKEGVPVTTAASQSGYQDYSTFLRTFRRIYHCTPTKYLEGLTHSLESPDTLNE